MPEVTGKPTVEIPIIQQMFNTCGLASILMLSYDKSLLFIRRNLIKLLEIIQPLIKDECKQKKNDICLQYALQYILLKIQNRECIRYRFLYNYLHGKFGYTFDDQVAVHTYLLGSKLSDFLNSQKFSYYDCYKLYLENRGLITPDLLQNEMLTMKTDLELKFLMEIFGFSFIPYESGDGTGALYIPKKAVGKRKTYHKLAKKLIQIVKDPKYRILYGFSNHWVAVFQIIESETNTEIPKIYYNDPMTASVKSIKIDQLDNSHRFYIFKRNKLNLNKLWENVLETVEEDIKTESHLQEMHAVEKVLASRKEKDSASALFAVLNPSINQESSHIKDNSKKEFFSPVSQNSEKSQNSLEIMSEKDNERINHKEKKKNISNNNENSSEEWDIEIDFEFED
ncbi:MAG: hypothetical protein K9W44_10030 [Candidatus Lokiarchaeota archaeon]|nr:hypothetical protein [Candidatus Harpocratesius repetitus]